MHHLGHGSIFFGDLGHPGFFNKLGYYNLGQVPEMYISLTLNYFKGISHNSHKSCLTYILSTLVLECLVQYHVSTNPRDHKKPKLLPTYGQSSAIPGSDFRDQESQNHVCVIPLAMQFRATPSAPPQISFRQLSELQRQFVCFRKG